MIGDTYTLIGGPQDGACVKQFADDMPNVIYVAPRWLGDGYAAWSPERSQRFPVKYSRMLHWNTYRFENVCHTPPRGFTGDPAAYAEPVQLIDCPEVGPLVRGGLISMLAVVWALGLYAIAKLALTR